MAMPINSKFLYWPDSAAAEEDESDDEEEDGRQHVSRRLVVEHAGELHVVTAGHTWSLLVTIASFDECWSGRNW